MRYFFRFFKRSRRIILRSKGEHYDLQTVYDEINALYFEKSLALGITWVGNRLSKPKTRIVLGSYHHHQKVIRINRVLDHPEIPHYFISFIVYHEMLHHTHPPRKRLGRREIHHNDFKLKEKQFEHYAQAKEFRKRFKNALFDLS